MNPLKFAGILGTAALAAGIAPSGFAAATVVIDDFSGGPHLVDLTSLAPPEIALGSFASAAALGGIRDVFVISETQGAFQAGVAFGTGGYASFQGTGRGGIVYDGVAGITDANNDKNLTPDELDWGLNLDLSDCEDGQIHLRAFADLANAHLSVALGSTATDYNIYLIDITNVGNFDDYYVDLTAPDQVFGSLDLSNVGAIALYHDGGDFSNLDIRVRQFDITCVPVPEPGTWLGMGGLAGLVGVTWLRSRKARS
jgi:hypothetical protein